VAAPPKSPLKEEPPAPVASAPVPPPAPPKPAPVSSDQNVDAAVVWERIAGEFSKNSFIRFGWLGDGVFDRLEEGRIVIRFPEASRESASSYFMEQGIKEIEQRLLKEFGRPVRLEFDFDESLQPAAAVEEAPEIREEPPAAAQAAPPPAEETPVDPMADFLNDPLIEKALEIFKGTLQTRQS
jgi:hypothetical protein